MAVPASGIASSLNPRTQKVLTLQGGAQPAGLQSADVTTTTTTTTIPVASTGMTPPASSLNATLTSPPRPTATLASGGTVTTALSPSGGTVVSSPPAGSTQTAGGVQPRVLFSTPQLHQLTGGGTAMVVRTSTGQHVILQRAAAAPGTPATTPGTTAATPAAATAGSTGTAPAAALPSSPPPSGGTTPGITTASPTINAPVSAALPTSPGGSTKYAVTPQVVEQVVRQAMLQNQDPEIQAKLMAMQRQMAGKSGP